MLADDPPKLIAVMGPTASGKTAVAETIAERLGAQLISADAFQVYRGFDIGTNKPPNRDDYLLLDIKNPDEGFGVGEWVMLASGALQGLFAEGRDVVIVGGTGFYVRALLEEWTDLQPPPDSELRDFLNRKGSEHGPEALVEMLQKEDPQAAASVDLQNPARVRRALERALNPLPSISFELPPFSVYKIGLHVDVGELNERIDRRAELMLANGWADEVDGLLQKGIQVNMPAMRAIGYSVLAQLVQGSVAYDSVLPSIQTATRHYAKRQRTWLRSEKGLRWLRFAGEIEHNSNILWSEIKVLLSE